METTKRYFIKDEVLLISEECFVNGFLVLSTNKEETKDAKEISEKEYNSILNKRNKNYEKNKLKKIASEAKILNSKRKKKEEVLKRLGVTEEEVSLFF